LSLQYRDDFAAKWFPLLYVGTNVAYLALALPIGRLADRIGRAKVLVLGHLALLGVYLLASLPAGGLTMTLACLLFLGIFYAATDGVLPALISRLVPAQARGTGIAAAQTVVALTRFVSSMAFSTLWLAIGSRNALLVTAVLLGATVPIAGWLLAPSDRAVA
jgi:MFS family permease